MKPEFTANGIECKRKKYIYRVLKCIRIEISIDIKRNFISNFAIFTPCEKSNYVKYTTLPTSSYRL